MHRNSKYHALKYVIECKQNGRAYFEPIAAIDHPSIAEDYARRAALKSIGNEYRLLERLSSGKWKTLFTTERETTDDPNTNHMSKEQLHANRKCVYGGGRNDCPCKGNCQYLPRD